MAKIEDYLPGGIADPNRGGDPLSANINDAAQQQEARQEQPRDPATGQFVPDATPSTDWETRYKELEKLNSRQAQTLGQQRKLIDDFIVKDPTPNEEPSPQESYQPITVDDLYEDPNAALQRAVDAHPAIQEARNIQKQYESDARDREANAFRERHPDYEQLASQPEFQNWVVDDPTRVNLWTRGNEYDFSAADALFRLYKAEKGMSLVQQQQSIEQAELVQSSGEMVTEPPRFSRQEYVAKLTRSKQGDLDAEEWVKRNAAGYRRALASGNVRD
jgi:hypothetical protein